MAPGITAGTIDTKAARLRRLWRRHDTNVRSRGLSQAVP